METGVKVDLRADDKVAAEMNKDFKSIEAKSKLSYGVDRKIVSVNLNKKITDQISFDMLSERFTGDSRGTTGEKSKDTAKLMYSISF